MIGNRTAGWERWLPAPLTKWGALPAADLVARFALLAAAALQVAYFLPMVRDAVFWRDEAAIVAAATEPAGVFIRFMAAELKPYSYYLSLRGWLWLFGATEAAARAFSLLTMVLGMALLYRGCLRWWGDRLAAATAAVLPVLASVALRQMVGFATSYAFAFFSVCWLWERQVALMAAPDRKRTQVAFLLASLVACHAHPVNVAFLAAASLVWVRAMLMQANSWPVRWRQACLVPLLIAVAMLPTVVQTFRFLSVETGTGRVPWEQFSAGYFARLFLDMLNQVSHLAQRLLTFASDDDLRGGASALVTGLPWWLALPLFAAAGVAIAAQLRGEARRQGWRLLDAVLLGVVPVILLGVASFVSDRMAMPDKSHAGYAPGLAILLAAGLLSRRSLLTAVLLLGLMRAAAGLPSFSEGRSGCASDGRAAAAYIAAEERQGDLVLLANCSMGPTFLRYYTGHARQIHHPFQNAVPYWRMTTLWRTLTDPGRLEPTLQAIRDTAAGGARIWFVQGGTPDPIPPHPWYSTADLAPLQTEMEKHFQRVNEVRFDRTLEPFRVQLYGPRSADAAGRMSADGAVPPGG